MFKNKKSISKDDIDNDAISASKRPGINWIMMIYFLSGACSLIDEVIWVRLLKLTLGNTVYASSIVVSMFMGGLALGAYIMSRYSDRIKRRLRLYALLETLVTISALAIPFALKAADHIYVWFYRSHHPSNKQLLLVQLVISAMILLVPSIIMGSTLPLLGRFVTAFEKEAGHLVGRLYALNTLGAAAGCFLAGFVFIRAFGVMGSLYIAAVLNLIVAFGGWHLSRQPKIIEGEAQENSAILAYENIPAKKIEGKFVILIIAFFLSGFISIGYEILWMRSIVHLLNGYTYVFSAVLTVYLLGNVIGVTIGSSLVKTLKTPALGFAVTLFLLGLCGVFYLPGMIIWSSKVLPWITVQVEQTSHIIPFSAFTAKPLVQSFSLFLIPTVIMGIGFPIALQAWTNQVHQVGRSTGTAYAANTIGAVLGGIVVGFILIPAGGLQFSIVTLGLSGIWIAGIMGLIFARSSQKVTRFVFPVTTIAITIIATVFMPKNMFNTVVAFNPDLSDKFELVAMKEGITTTVTIMRNSDEDTLYLYTSGQRVAGDTYFWRSDQKMLGHFGSLLNKNTTKELSVGFGSGESTACFALHHLERADCAEIAPEIVELSQEHFSHINLGNRLNDEINMIYMDAKNYLHLTDVKYDVIVNDSIHPRQFAENASLYTKEYYESARDHLEENGLFLSWIPAQIIEPPEMVNSIIGTMMEVFPYVTIWYMTPRPGMFFLMSGSVQPQYFSPKHMEDELNKEGVRESLSLTNIYNSLDIMSCYIGDKNDLERYIKNNYKENSDYTPFIEFITNNNWGGNGKFLEFIRTVRNDSVYKHIDWSGLNDREKEKWLSDFAKIYDISTYLLLTNGTSDVFEKIEYCAEGLKIIPDNPALLDVTYINEQYAFSKSLEFIDNNVPDAALNISAELLKINPDSAMAQVIRSAALQKKGDIQQSLEAAYKAIENGPGIADVHMQMGLVFMEMALYQQAIEELTKAMSLGENDYFFASRKKIKLLNALINIYILTGNIPEAVETAQTAVGIAQSTGRYKAAEEFEKRIESLQVEIEN